MKTGPFPFADKFMEFQEALEKYGSLERSFQSNMEKCTSDQEPIREELRQSKVKVLSLYNKVLTASQKSSVS